jgi:hypothetical protein
MAIPDRREEHMGETKKSRPRQRSLEEFRRNKLQRARSTVIEAVIERTDKKKEIDLVHEFRVSSQLLGDYVTLDWPHYQAITRVRSAISQYAEDKSRRRPLNIMMQAEPGSGKSHLVKSLAKSISKHNAVAIDYNMASLQSIEDFLQPLDSVRNVKVQDKLPILFLDEFDSDPSRYPLLLPLMWDGELNIAHRNLKLGKLVIILAGSSVSIGAAISTAKGMQAAGAAESGKLIDLVSRINGGELEIPPLDLVESDRDRRADKVCLTISLLKARFGVDLELIPLSLLRFVATSKFRYGVRSLAHFIDLIQPFSGDAESTTELLPKQLQFPLNNITSLRNSSLAYHVFSEDGAAAIVDHWKSVSSEEAVVRIREEAEEDDIAF